MNLKLRLTLALLSLFFAGSVSAQWQPAGFLTTGQDTARKVYTMRTFNGRVYIGTDKGLFIALPSGVVSLLGLSGVPVKSVFVDSTGDVYTTNDTSICISTNQGASFGSIRPAGNLTLHGIYGLQVNGKSRIFYSYGDNTNFGVNYSDDNFTTTTAANKFLTIPYSFTEMDNVLYIGGQDGIYKLNIDNESWRNAGTGYPGGSLFGSMAAVNGVLYAADWNGQGLYVSRDTAKNWEPANTTVFHDQCQVYDVAGNKDTVVAVMDGACTDQTHPVRASGDGGRSWQTYMVGLQKGSYTSVAYNSATRCFYTFENNTHQLYTICQNTTGIGNPKAAALDFSVYPNPATDYLRVKVSYYKPGMTGTILNVLGEKVSAFTVEEATQDLPIGKLNPGVYYLQISSNQNIGTVKFVKY
jgi:hypothetical protein